MSSHLVLSVKQEQGVPKKRQRKSKVTEQHGNSSDHVSYCSHQ